MTSGCRCARGSLAGAMLDPPQDGRHCATSRKDESEEFRPSSQNMALSPALLAPAQGDIAPLLTTRSPDYLGFVAHYARIQRNKYRGECFPVLVPIPVLPHENRQMQAVTEN